MLRRDLRHLWKRYPATVRRVRLTFDCLEDRRTPATIVADFALAAPDLGGNGPATATLAPAATAVRSQAIGADGPIEFLHPFCLISFGTDDDGVVSDDLNGPPPLMPELSPSAPRTSPRPETPSTPPADSAPRVELESPPAYAPREVPVAPPVNTLRPAVDAVPEIRIDSFAD